MPIDYSMGKLYIIESPLTAWRYIGSTCQTLAQRMSGHRRDGRRKTTPLYNAFDEFGADNFSIRLLRLCPSRSREELEAREFDEIREYIRLNGKTLYNVTVPQGSVTQRTSNRHNCWEVRWQAAGVQYRKTFLVSQHGKWKARHLAYEYHERLFPRDVNDFNRSILTAVIDRKMEEHRKTERDIKAIHDDDISIEVNAARLLTEEFEWKYRKMCQVLGRKLGTVDESRTRRYVNKVKFCMAYIHNSYTSMTELNPYRTN